MGGITIDAHQHFWRYSPEEYGWIDESMKVLRRDFLPADLEREAAAAEVGGVVSVQARQTVEETAWLLELGRRHQLIRGVVGWAPLAEGGVEKTLENFAGEPKLKGVRHVVQGEPDGFMLRDDFNRGVALLGGRGLRYDILIVERQLAEAIAFVDRHPGQVFVLDHMAKPRIRAGEREPWGRNVWELARRPNVYCKVSGMVTEADPAAWREEHLTPYVETVLEAFGPARLMFGSDWPVCLAAATYQRWAAYVRGAISRLTAAEQARIMGGTAEEAYGL